MKLGTNLRTYASHIILLSYTLISEIDIIAEIRIYERSELRIAVNANRAMCLYTYLYFESKELLGTEN